MCFLKKYLRISQRGDMYTHIQLNNTKLITSGTSRSCTSKVIIHINIIKTHGWSLPVLFTCSTQTKNEHVPKSLLVFTDLQGTVEKNYLKCIKIKGGVAGFKPASMIIIVLLIVFLNYTPLWFSGLQRYLQFKSHARRVVLRQILLSNIQ